MEEVIRNPPKTIKILRNFPLTKGIYTFIGELEYGHDAKILDKFKRDYINDLIKGISFEDKFQIKFHLSDRYNWRIYNKNAKGKNLEPSTTELLKHLLKRSDLFVDIGANIDYYSLLAVSILGTSGKVYSFEPSQQTYNRLRENITLNSFSTLSHTRWQFLTNLLQLNYT